MKSYIDIGPYWENLNVEQREDACNGMGAEWMHELLRKILDKCFEVFKEPIDIHDVGYEYGLTEEDKEAEDKRMRMNMIKASWNEIGFKDWKKMVRFIGYAEIAYILCTYCGDKAFWKDKVKI